MATSVTVKQARQSVDTNEKVIYFVFIALLFRVLQDVRTHRSL